MIESKRRAMRDDQKQLRRQEILDVTWQLFQTSGYSALTMAQVAERVALAKGTLYLYFKTKEELFLAVQEQQFVAWFDDLDQRFAAAPQPCSTGDLAELIGASLAQRTGLVSLLAILHTVLEHNVDFVAALRFKRMLLERVTRLGVQLEACLPSLAAGRGAELLLQIYALIIGVEHLASPAPVVREVLRAPGMQLFDIQFGPTFAAALRTLLRGAAERSDA